MNRTHVRIAETLLLLRLQGCQTRIVSAVVIVERHGVANEAAFRVVLFQPRQFQVQQGNEQVVSRRVSYSFHSHMPACGQQHGKIVCAGAARVEYMRWIVMYGLWSSTECTIYLSHVRLRALT
jgi:hypothetical protein